MSTTRSPHDRVDHPEEAFDVVLSVYNFTMDKTMDDAIAAVAKTGTGVVAMKVMAGGFRRVKPTEPDLRQAPTRWPCCRA